MQYVWQHRLIPSAGLRTVDGRRVAVVNPGLLNTDAGPDFFNATVEIDGQTWVGNVEIHVKASDWYRHGHDRDKTYDTVILHVVDRDDAAVRRSDGQVVAQMRMPCSPNLNADFHSLVDKAADELTCAAALKTLPSVYVTDWMTSLALERIEEKADRIGRLLESTAGNWEEACYVTIARSLGYGINGDPFERLARSTPTRFMRKHSDSLLTLEAILFGQSGLLDRVKGFDSYVDRLRREYEFMRAKFGLRRPEELGWKMSRMRPTNFPFRRIALLAQMLHDGFSLMSRIAEVKTLADARRLFDVELSGFWARHYTFEGGETAVDIKMSRSSVDLLVINSVVPLLYAYGGFVGDNEMAERAMSILEEMKPEDNFIVRLFSAAGLKVDSAFMSQAVIELRRNYCEKRKCLFCRVGHRVLSERAIRR